MHIEYVESIDKSKRIFLFPTEPFSEKIKNENGKYLYAKRRNKINAIYTIYDIKILEKY